MWHSKSFVSSFVVAKQPDVWHSQQKLCSITGLSQNNNLLWAETFRDAFSKTKLNFEPNFSLGKKLFKYWIIGFLMREYQPPEIWKAIPNGSVIADWSLLFVQLVLLFFSEKVAWKRAFLWTRKRYLSYGEWSFRQKGFELPEHCRNLTSGLCSIAHQVLGARWTILIFLLLIKLMKQNAFGPIWPKLW